MYFCQSLCIKYEIENLDNVLSVKYDFCKIVYACNFLFILFIKKYFFLFFSTCTFKYVFISFCHAVNLRLYIPVQLPGQQILMNRRIINKKREMQITYIPLFCTVLSFALQIKLYLFKIYKKYARTQDVAFKISENNKTARIILFDAFVLLE